MIKAERCLRDDYRVMNFHANPIFKLLKGHRSGCFVSKRIVVHIYVLL